MIARLLLTWAAALAVAADPAPSNKAAKAFERGDLWGAVAAMRLLPPHDPLRCKLLLLQNRAGDAAACYQVIADRDPGDKNALNGLALSAFHAGEYGRAADAYGRAGRTLRASLMRAFAGAPAYQIVNERAVHAASFVKVDPLPLLSVRLSDGRDHVVLLDTGGAETILDPKVAEAVGVKTVDGSSTGMFAAGQQAQIRFGVLEKMEIGNLSISHIPIAIQPTSQFAPVVNVPAVDGVIGVDLLRHFIATIDYPGGKLILRPLGSSRTRGSASPFWMAEDHLLLSSARIDELDVLALLDTGLAGQGCTLPQSTFDSIGARGDGGKVEGEGGGGHSSASTFTAKRIALGLAVQSDVPCLLGPFPPPLERSTGTHIGLLISHAFFRRYAVTFDFGRMIVTLQGRSAPNPSV